MFWSARNTSPVDQDTTILLREEVDRTARELSCPAQPPLSGISNDRMTITSRLRWGRDRVWNEERKNEFNNICRNNNR